MVETASPERIEAIYDLLIAATGILRDDDPFVAEKSVFGKLTSSDDRYKLPGAIYGFENNYIPKSEITMTMVDDPLNYSADRENIKLVPSKFEIVFLSRVESINPSMIKRKLDLADYWVGVDGKMVNGNDLGSGLPPNTLEHRYRFRANDEKSSKFPVDVELFYFDAQSEQNANAKSTLWMIEIRRAYPYMTPEIRKRKREEQGVGNRPNNSEQPR